MSYSQETPPAAWWMNQRIRLALLLMCLAAVVAYLLATRIGVQSFCREHKMYS